MKVVTATSVPMRETSMLIDEEKTTNVASELVERGEFADPVARACCT